MVHNNNNKSLSKKSLAAEKEKLVLKLAKIEGKRRGGQQRMRCLESTTDSMDVSVSKLQDTVKDREAWVLQPTGSQRVGHDLAIEQQQQ